MCAVHDKQMILTRSNNPNESCFKHALCDVGVCYERCVHWLVEVDEPDGDLSRRCLVPVDGVAFGQCDHWLELLVVFSLTQGTL